MKKKILIAGIASCLCIHTTFSQLEQGNVLLGGGANTGLNFDDGYSSFNIDIAPDVGYFVIDNLAVGAYLPLGFYKSENYRRLTYGLAPFIRYYPMFEDNIGFFVGTDIGAEGRSRKTNDDSESDWTYILGFETGAAVFLNESIALEVALRYDYNNFENVTGIGDDRLDNSRLSINLGFQVYFNPN